ncbi:uncharacterized protein [Solanum tuberosum]|uniref:Uncharacterized protein n=1 Tax=Solanum tuberosum TaxID=4113 RepID=M1C566_SOLTU|nr:PREDICTED: uncharacterized protein LOC102600238 [Solanum tuberosum]KAH0673542.1 hypothetical protein KY284_024629 [Solanum tuberosum]
MAFSSSISLSYGKVCSGFHYNKQPILSKYFKNSHISAFLSTQNGHQLKLKEQILRASFDSEGLPSEITEDSKFVSINAKDPKYGPPALLLLGFEVDEAAKIQQLLKEMDGEFLQVIFCTEDMISRSLWEAMNTKQTNLDASKIAKQLPRICFLSGLTGEEMMMFLDAFEESGLEDPVFAALVPNSAEKPLQELIDEIMGDHELLSSKNSS